VDANGLLIAKISFSGAPKQGKHRPFFYLETGFWVPEAVGDSLSAGNGFGQTSSGKQPTQPPDQKTAQGK